MKSTAHQSIGDLAARFGLGTHVLRHWEDKGLLTPRRDASGRRWYDEDDVVRVAVILRSKAAGMGLEQIRVLLDADARGRHVLLEAHVAALDLRMAEMVQSRAMTVHALECEAHDVTSCPNFRASVQDLLAGAGWTGVAQPSSSSPPQRSE